MKTELDEGKPLAEDLSWMFAPVHPNRFGRPEQKVVATIGAPGSGKSTLSHTLDPNEWLVLTLDDWRAALWPPHRRVYWDVRAGPRDKQAQSVLHDVQIAAIESGLSNGWNLFLADTHVNPKAFLQYVRTIRWFGIQIKWKFFDIPKEVILERNKTRPPEHRLPEEVLERIHTDLWKEDAWWRQIPSDQIEIIKWQTG